MKAIIPTAGVGKRLRPFTHTVPKVLLQVADKPILGHIIDRLGAAGIGDVTFVVGYRGEMIEEYVRKAYPQLETRFVEQGEPRGLGHAIHMTAGLHRDDDGPLLIILGDTLVDVDLGALERKTVDMIAVREVDDPTRFGIVELDGERITNMVEKPDDPATDLAVVGLYRLTNPALLFECLDETVGQETLTAGELQLTDALRLMLTRGAEMHKFSVDSWYDCGTPETLLSTNRSLLRRNFMDRAEEIRLRYPTVRVKPPVFVDPQARVHDSIIGPDVTIAAGVTASESIITNSIINEGAEVADVVLANSIIGNHAQVRANALRLNVGDRSEVVFDSGRPMERRM